MSDLISRQAAIDAVFSLCEDCDSGYCGSCRVNYPGEKDVIKVIRNLPPAQPEPCEDAVSREAVSSWLKQYGQDVLHGKYKFSLMYIWKNLMDLPSAQPEPRWVLCSERLPRQGQEVICQCRANMIKVLKLDACGDWYQDAEHCYMSGFVIAWMPLPEPYAERRTDE